MQKVLAVFPEKCTACKLCELACSFTKIGEFNPIRSRIKISVLMEDHFYMPMVCMQCHKAPCQAICPTNCIDISKDTGHYFVNHERCIGCRMCIMACPFGVIEYGLEGDIEKCDHCEGNPECVRICPTGALEYRDLSTTATPTAASFANKMLEAQKGVQVA